MADLQKAIQKADRVKKQAQVKGKIDQARRERQKKLTAEERKAIRQSKRLTVELQHSESRVKVSFFSCSHSPSFPVFPLLPSCFFSLENPSLFFPSTYEMWIPPFPFQQSFLFGEGLGLLFPFPSSSFQLLSVLEIHFFNRFLPLGLGTGTCKMKRWTNKFHNL